MEGVDVLCERPSQGGSGSRSIQVRSKTTHTNTLLKPCFPISLFKRNQVIKNIKSDLYEETKLHNAVKYICLGLFFVPTRTPSTDQPKSLSSLFWLPLSHCLIS